MQARLQLLLLLLLVPEAVAHSSNSRELLGAGDAAPVRPAGALTPADVQPAAGEQSEPVDFTSSFLMYTTSSNLTDPADLEEFRQDYLQAMHITLMLLDIRTSAPEVEILDVRTGQNVSVETRFEFEADSSAAERLRNVMASNRSLLCETVYNSFRAIKSPFRFFAAAVLGPADVPGMDLWEGGTGFVAPGCFKGQPQGLAGCSCLGGEVAEAAMAAACAAILGGDCQQRDDFLSANEQQPLLGACDNTAGRSCEIEMRESLQSLAHFGCLRALISGVGEGCSAAQAGAKFSGFRKAACEPVCSECKTLY